MKTTYLVYKQVNGIRQLVTATQEEWDAILKKNRSLPLSERRHFIKDCFEDGDELDCMYIEVPASEHREWNSKKHLSLLFDKHRNSRSHPATGYVRWRQAFWKGRLSDIGGCAKTTCSK